MKRVLAQPSTKRQEAFLVNLANLHGLEDLKSFGPRENFDLPARSLWHRFPEFRPNFPEHPEAEQTLYEFLSQEERVTFEKLSAPERDAHWTLVLSNVLRRAWMAPNSRTRAWRMFSLRQQILSFLMPQGWKAPSEPPDFPILEAVNYLESQGHRARRCKNLDCVTPFFFVKRRGEEYCGDDCRAPSRSAAKRRWWAEKGEEWRRNRSKSRGKP